MADLNQARQFMAANARLLDRRRFESLAGGGDPEATLAVLGGYRNDDGGFGWALHPDLRSATSQPVAALHVFEILEEVAAESSPIAASLCDWLDHASLADGGLPFALPFDDGAGSAPMWAATDSSRSSLLITCAVCAGAHRITHRNPAIAVHRWLARATEYCLEKIAAMKRPAMAIELRFALELLDALHDREAGAADELQRVGSFLPASAAIPVQGGAEGEAMRPLDFSPVPGRPIRELIADDVIAAALDDLEAEQDRAGGWDVDFTVYSPAARVEWRGEATVRAIRVLRANGRRAELGHPDA
jgi:hypothetical protein